MYSVGSEGWLTLFQFRCFDLFQLKLLSFLK